MLISALAEESGEALAAELSAIGAEDCAVAGRVVSARLPVGAIPSLAGLAHVRFARAALAVSHSGAVSSQGDHAMGADTARDSFGFTGTGIRVGILSDSFNSLGGMEEAIGAGELPADTLVLRDATGGADEGRAMGEIIHDVAPGASLAFRTAWLGDADFAQGIRELHAAGCRVIVDDVLYLNEPMFADGVIAQAVDEVSAAGTAYFSSAGNAGMNAYTAPFTSAPDGCHDFDPSSGTDTVLNVSCFPGTTWFVLQWADRYASTGFSNPGAATDLDIEFLDKDGNLVPGVGGFEANLGGDPIEIFGIELSWAAENMGVDAGLRIRRKSGPAPAMVKLVWYTTFALGQYEYLTPSSTLYGHMNARGAMAAGAAWYCSTPAFGTTPPLVQSYSSLGGTPVYYAPDGTPSYEVRRKPDFCAPDGTDNSFFGRDSDCSSSKNLFPNFAGTSAAAPHAAAVAALMLEARPATASPELRAFLQNTAVEMGDPGFDFRTGYGLVQAEAVRRLVSEIEVRGNNAIIGDGDTTPSTADHTSFGSTCRGTTVSRTFTVKNLGGTALTTSGLTVPSGYTVTEALAASIAAGGQDTFTVRLNAAAAGTFAGDIRFAHNDINETPFNFRISGVVNASEIEVKGNSVAIADGDATPSAGDHTDFGATAVGTPVSRTFTVRNTGTAACALITSGLTVPTGFTVTEALATSIAASGQDTFTVRLNATTAGTYGGDVTFTNNDPNEGAFNFRITGQVNP